MSTYEPVTLWQIYFGHFKKTQTKKSRQKYIKSLELLFVWEKPLILFFNDGGIGNSLHLGFLFCFTASTKRRNETKWNLSKINGLLSVMKRKHAPIAFTLVFPSLFYTLELDSLSSEYKMNWDEEYLYCVRASCLCILIVSYVMTLYHQYQDEPSSTQLNNIEPGSSFQIM